MAARLSARVSAPLISGSNIFRPENLSVWQIPVFRRYGLLMRNQGYIEFEKFEKQCVGHI
jgi:hypothetical protein